MFEQAPMISFPYQIPNYLFESFKQEMVLLGIKDLLLLSLLKEILILVINIRIWYGRMILILMGSQMPPNGPMTSEQELGEMENLKLIQITMKR